ncbi:hypothetical protein [Streptomyces sp. NPDC048172]|uniref:hypothetical protein n=1 Tax=Streptomyces sp. NPDC048172 TaxID=3365505 RepID=UPI003715A10F
MANKTLEHINEVSSARFGDLTEHAEAEFALTGTPIASTPAFVALATLGAAGAGVSAYNYAND